VYASAEENCAGLIRDRVRWGVDVSRRQIRWEHAASGDWGYPLSSRSMPLASIELRAPIRAGRRFDRIGRPCQPHPPARYGFVVPDGSRSCQRCTLRAVFAKTGFIDFPFRSRPFTADEVFPPRNSGFGRRLICRCRRFIRPGNMPTLDGSKSSHRSRRNT